MRAYGSGFGRKKHGGAAMLSVGLLGVFRVANVDNRIWSELGPAGRGLASFLFTYPGRPHRRERLADLFWPELDTERARRALNSAIWRLRKLLATQPESDGGENLQTIGSETVLEPPSVGHVVGVVLAKRSSSAFRVATYSCKAPSSRLRVTSCARIIEIAVIEYTP